MRPYMIACQTGASKARLRYVGLCLQLVPLYLTLTKSGPATVWQIILDVEEMKVVFETYRDFMKSKGQPESSILALTSFYRLWRTEFPHVRLRRRKTIASKCHVCEDLEVGTTADMHISSADPPARLATT